MFLYSGMVTGMLCIVLMLSGKQGLVMGSGEAGCEFEPSDTGLKVSWPDEPKWVLTDQPRCCSDCTYVAAGFKCKVKSCLYNCPWASSAAAPTARPVF